MKFDQLLTVEDFLPLVGRTFRVNTVPKPVDLVLDRVVRRPPNPLAAREPFILVYSSPWAVLLTQAVYQMECGSAGSFEFLLTPTQVPHHGPGNPERRLYHAVFS